MKKFFTFLLIFFLFFTKSFALDITKIDVNKIYNKFYSRVEKEYNKKNLKKYLENIEKIFVRIKNNSKKKSVRIFASKLSELNSKKILLLSDNTKILSGEKQNKIEQKKIITKNFLDLQKELESGEIEKLKKLKKNIGDYKIKYLQNLGFEVIFVNQNMEFEKNNKIQKIFFKKYYKIEDSNYKLLAKKDKNSKIIISGEKIFFVSDYKLEEKIPFSQVKKIITKEKKYFLENGVYYTFIFDKYLSDGDKYGFYNSILEKNGLSPKKIIFYYDSKKFNFIKDYKKVKIISAYIIENITNKEKFLNKLAQDIKIFQKNYDEYFLKLKKISLGLTKNLDTSEKIKKIYSYLVDNLSYFTGDYNKNKQVFSGVETFKNKIGVCEGYVKLFLYMASFAQIEDVSIIKGYVFSSADFPNVGHAWIKIKDKFYDPTFDDPIGNSGIKKENYLYFSIKKDLFYTNRFDFGNKDLLEKYKNLSLEERQKIQEKNLYNFIKKYPNSNLVKTILYKYKLGFAPGEKITIDKLKTKLKFLKVDKNFNFIDNSGKKRYMTEIRYFNINDKNAGILLKQEKQNFLNAYLLQKGNKYYLAVNFKFK